MNDPHKPSNWWFPFLGDQRLASSGTLYNSSWCQFIEHVCVYLLVSLTLKDPPRSQSAMAERGGFSGTAREAGSQALVLDWPAPFNARSQKIRLNITCAETY